MAAKKPKYSPEALKRRMEYQREFARKYRKSPKGYASSREAWAKYKKSLTKEEIYKQTRQGSWNYKLKKYGLTDDAYMAMAKNGCAICGQINTWRGTHARLCFDHNHQTGKFRGLLCHSCNSALGYLKDDLTLVKAALQYLQERS